LLPGRITKSLSLVAQRAFDRGLCSAPEQTQWLKKIKEINLNRGRRLLHARQRKHIAFGRD